MLKTLCQEKERHGCQLSPLAERWRDASNAGERNDDPSSDDKHCKLTWCMMTEVPEAQHELANVKTTSERSKMVQSWLTRHLKQDYTKKGPASYSHVDVLTW